MRFLEVEIAKLFGNLTYMVSHELRAQAAEAGSTRNPYEDAVEYHAEAERLFEAILDHVHGRGNGGATRATHPGEAPPELLGSKSTG